MKRRLLLLLFFAMAFTIVFFPVEAEAKIWDEGYCDGFYWYVSETNTRDEYTLHLSWNYRLSEIPDNLKNASWRMYASQITTVSIDSNVWEIGYRAFAGMSNLSKVYLPSSVTHIRGEAFANCPKLTSFYLPAKLELLENRAFANTGITSIRIPTTIRIIYGNPFADCDMSHIYYCGTAEQWNQVALYAGPAWDSSIFFFHCWQDATCTTPQTCSYCGATLGKSKGHTWQDATCTRPKACACGATEGEPLGHNYTNENCEIIQEATCSATGRIKYTCTRCSQTFFETAEKLPHTYGAWQEDPRYYGKHKRTCSVCNDTQREGHIFSDEIAEIIDPTCNSFGAIYRSCTICDAKMETEELPKLPHGAYCWVYSSDSYHRAVCSICNENIGIVESHAWDSGVVTKEPTCIDIGEIIYTCTVCNGTRTEKITAAAPHQYTEWTNANPDQHYCTCTVCGNSEFASHAWNSGVVTKRPTCAEEGVLLRTCTVCNGVKEYPIDRLDEHTFDHACDTECNVCGDVRTVPHSYSANWSKTAEKHYHECSKCGFQKEASAHIPGPAATETVPQSCTVCGYILAPVLNHMHDFLNVWSFNREGHWHSCIGCEEQQGYAEHVFDNACDTDCNDCGYERIVTHSYSASYKSDAEGHWLECTVCGARKNNSAHFPGPAPTTTIAQNCTTCGYEIAPPVPENTEHSSTMPANTNPTSSTVQNDVPSGEVSGPSSANETVFTQWILLLVLVLIAGTVIFLAVNGKKKR